MAFPPLDRTLSFVFHGLDLTTRSGEPIHVGPHLLRHVAATAAREHEVPLQAVSRLMLHHTQTPQFDGETYNAPEATLYYTQPPAEQDQAAVGRFFDEIEQSLQGSISLVPPTEQELASMNDALRDVFSKWHTGLPVMFGYCGSVGLCPRGHDRWLCIGCPFLIPDPDKRAQAIKWRDVYFQQAEDLAQTSEETDARHARLRVQHLDDLINVMDLMRDREIEGWFTPFYRALPSPVNEDDPLNG